MFIHDYLLDCEISTVRTLALIMSPSHTRSLMSLSSSCLASSTLSFLPISVISSWSASFCVGNTTRAPVLSRTFLMLAPPRPIRNLWYSGLARISAVKLDSFCNNSDHPLVRYVSLYVLQQVFTFSTRYETFQH